MLVISKTGEAIEAMGQPTRARGRRISESEVRKVNDIVYGILLASGYSPTDANRILLRTISDRCRRLRRQQIAMYSVSVDAGLRALARRASNAV